jgi:DNA-binding transcriptional regulator YiaG
MPINYPKTLETLGDHIKSRRLALGLFQRQVADELRTDETTLFRWEHNMARPQIRYFPQILNFLGYDPFPVSVTVADKLRAARRRLGFTQKAFAERLGVDPTTLRKWEQGRARPNKRSLKIISRQFVAQGTAPYCSANR